jgi:hypothetical protein
MSAFKKICNFVHQLFSHFIEKIKEIVYNVSIRAPTGLTYLLCPENKK